MAEDIKSTGLPDVSRHVGDTTFGVACLVFSLFLFSQMWSQTAWQPGGSFAAQPGFWPRLAVVGMVLCSAANLYASFADIRAKERLTGLGEELIFWVRSVEFALWFMAYVFATPLIGYLAASLLFATALALRVGYRSGRAMLAAVAVGAAVVLFFKSFLQVKIPGGAVYEALPDALRNFFILYL